MAYINSLVLDNGLNVLTDGNRVDICSQLPADYTEATTTYTLGNKTGVTVSSPTDATPTGRKVTIATISDGDVTGTGDASHWALVDTVNSRLLAANTIADGGQPVTTGNKFSAGSVDITNPGVVIE